MSKCLNPDCLAVSLSQDKYCTKCRSKLLLKERYRALKIIGEGGFGRTFLAIDEDKPSKPNCVIKQFLPQAQGTSNLEKAAELFAQEAERLDELGKHEQIPELLAYFTTDNRQYLIQQFIEGENLQQELKSKGNFNEQKIRELLADILKVLKFVHQNKVIHRDIKPENIIRMASDKKLFLVDFGASKVVENSRLSVTGTVIGSAQYCPPEQSIGKPQYCSDLYSLGVTCLHLLTGIDPFDLFDSGEGEWVWRDYLQNNPVSNELGQVLDKLVQSAYKKRYQSVDEVMSALNLSTVKQTSSQSTVAQTSSQSTVAQASSLSSVKQASSLSQGQQASSLSSVKQVSSLSQAQQTTGRMPVPQIPIKPVIQSHSNFTETLPGGIKLEMIAIPAGEFMMGSNKYDNEKPIHKVTLKEFYMGKYPVTQAQYQAIMGNNPSYFKDSEKAPLSKGGWGVNPVEKVSWDDAQEFCQKLSQKTGKKYKLPSEAQWEYACRAGSTGKWSFGDDENQLKDYAWYRDNSNSQTHPVGQKKPNKWGLYDMHGNVWEWCEDDYVDNYKNTLTDGTSYINQNMKYKCLRGGSWYFISDVCASANRNDNFARLDGNDVGFRVALAVPVAKK